VERHIFWSISLNPVFWSYLNHVGVRIHTHSFAWKRQKSRAKPRGAEFGIQKKHPYFAFLCRHHHHLLEVHNIFDLLSIWMNLVIRLKRALIPLQAFQTPLLRSHSSACPYVSAAACPSFVSLLPPSLHTHVHAHIHSRTHKWTPVQVLHKKPLALVPVHESCGIQTAAASMSGRLRSQPPVLSACHFIFLARSLGHSHADTARPAVCTLR